MTVPVVKVLVGAAAGKNLVWPSAATGVMAQFVVLGRWIVFDRYPGDPVRTGF